MADKISRIQSQTILDSRGYPTVEVMLELSSGMQVRAAVPSGASVGQHEAVELRDQDPNRWMGQGVEQAIKSVEEVLAPALLGLDPCQQHEIDHQMIDLDGTENKSRLGANAILAVSLAAARAGAVSRQQSLYKYLAETAKMPQPSVVPLVPMFNVINGGKHAVNTIRFQEFLLEPHGFDTVEERIEAGTVIYYHLKKLLDQMGQSVGLGDEGGFAPSPPGNDPEEVALEWLMRAIEQAGFSEEQIGLGLDVAASSLPDHYHPDYHVLLSRFPLRTIEDPFDEEDWPAWAGFVRDVGKFPTVIGDDLLTTNPNRIRYAIDHQAVSGVLIKLNQIGTVSETLQAIQLAKEAGLVVAISHRSGETTDDFIADLAVAVQADYLKAGAPARGERVAKYNRVLQIANDLRL